MADQKKDERLDRLMIWLKKFDDIVPDSLEPASADASFRRYFRVRGASSLIVMDAPPEQEDCGPFLQIAGYLQQMGLNSPRILAADLEQGFLLLTDLGSTPYLSALEAQPDHAARLYDDALSALLTLQHAGRHFQHKLPPYTADILHFELSLFHDWLCERHLCIKFSASEQKAWRDTCDFLVTNVQQQEKVFVHRDFHSRNLMVTVTDNPGIIDFQDALEGPLTYDLVSLLKDCYIKWPIEQIHLWAASFHARLPAGLRDTTGHEQFMRQFDLMGVQRHMKAAGIFARLLRRDGKSGYLQDVPRTLSYVVDVAPDYAELSFLAALITERVLPALNEAG